MAEDLRLLYVALTRAVSAAVFGDPEKVEFIPLNTNVRFQALQSGDKMDLTIQKAVELGAVGIVPVAAVR